MFTVDKNPLREIDQGVEDVIGQQSSGVGIDITKLIQALINSILGFGTDFLAGIEAELGTLIQIDTFFTNTLKFLGELDPLSPTFNVADAAKTFLQTVAIPTSLIAPLLPNASDTIAGLTGFVPTAHIDTTAIGNIIGSAQGVIDAILETVGFAAGSGTVTEVNQYFTDLLAMLANPALTGGAFNAATAVGNFITTMVQPHNLLAPMDPASLLIAATHIPSLPAGWGKTIDGSLLVNAITNATLTAAALTAGAIPAGVTLGAAALTAGAIGAGVTIAGSALTSAIAAANVPALPAGWGKTIDGSLIVGAISAAIITGVLNQAQIPALTSSWGKTVDGALIAGNVLSTAVIPPITPPMTSGLALIDDVTNAIQATSTVGNTAAQMQYALANMPHVNVQPLVGTVATDLGGSLQAHIDAGIQAITGSTATGNPLSLFQTALGQFTSHVGLVTVNQPYVSPSSVTAVSQANGAYIQQQSINYEIQHGVDPTSNGPFDLSLVAPAALTTIAVSQGTAVQCFDQLPFGGVKQSVRWLGYPSSGASFTDFRVNIYQLNTTTGIETLVYASENIAAGISAGSTPVWKAYNMPSGAVQTLSLGTTVVPPAGPGFPYTFPFTLVAARSFTLTFSGQTTAAIPYPATAVSLQNALAALSNIGTGKVLVCDNGGENFVITFAGSMAATTQSLITVNSTNLPNATPTVTNFLAAAQGDVFAAEIVVTGTGSYNIVGITNNLPVHTNAIPARFGATRPAGSLAFTYVAATPWIGLASTTTASAAAPPYVPATFNPVLMGFGSSTVIQNPAVTYPLANYFDVIVFGAGGGGGGAGAASGGVGGYAAAHNIWTGVTRALMGTAGLTITVGGGGGAGSGGSTGSPGGDGAGSSVVIPGWTTLPAGGGPGGGTGGPTYGGDGQSESSATWNDAYGNPHSIAGGAGGAGGGFGSPAAGSQAGGGGAGGTSPGPGPPLVVDESGASGTVYAPGWGGGPGGAGAVYIYCYQ